MSVVAHGSGDWHDLWLTVTPLALSAAIFLRLRSHQDVADAERQRPSAKSGGFEMLRRLLSMYQSSVGRKFVMALSGLAILGFVVAHLIGTLKIFLGPEETDAYGEALRGLGGDLVPHGHVLWVLRIGLLGAFAVHLHAAFTLDRRNRKARSDQAYRRQSFSAASYASRTMLWSGIIVGLFIVFHIADLTWGATSDEFVTGEVYDNQIRSFSTPWIAAIYLAAIAALVAHLHHGVASLFQSLGGRVAWMTEVVRRRIAMAVTGSIGLGYASIPIAVQIGVLS